MLVTEQLRQLPVAADLLYLAGLNSYVLPKRGRGYPLLHVKRVSFPQPC